jgi:hypothetical protein
MYRELVKSGRASFHYDAVKDGLLKQLCLQQRSIAFFRKWDRKRVKHLSYRTLAAESLMRDLVKALVKFKRRPAVVAFLNSSERRRRIFGPAAERRLCRAGRRRVGCPRQ